MQMETLREVYERMAAAARRAGRNPQTVRLVAVTKTQPPQEIDTALAAGILCIGENRVQEAETKLPLLTHPVPQFHFIGHLQTNKGNKLMALRPALIHSLDSPDTAAKIHDWLAQHNATQDVLVQVNTSGEASKSGVEPGEAMAFCRSLSVWPRLRLRGLMTIGALTTDSERIRQCFRLLRALRDELTTTGYTEATELSMGMSGDFELAIEEGATLVRLGSVLFGARHYV